MAARAMSRAGAPSAARSAATSSSRAPLQVAAGPRRRRQGGSAPEPRPSAAAAATATSSSTASSSSSSLAIYRLADAARPLARPAPAPAASPVPFTLETLTQTIVRQLDGGPFLLRVRTQPWLCLDLVRLGQEELAAGWQHVRATHLAAAAPQAPGELLALVHPVSEQQPCVVHQVQGAPCPGCPHSRPGAAAAAAAPAGCASGADQQPTELLHGKFGECCHDEGDGHSHSHAHSHAAPQPAATSAGGSAQQTAFWGLVVQCSDAADALGGCYLLKTSQVLHAAPGGCHCTSFSLSRVCRGPSLQQQFTDSWLV